MYRRKKSRKKVAIIVVILIASAAGLLMYGHQLPLSAIGTYSPECRTTGDYTCEIPPDRHIVGNEVVIAPVPCKAGTTEPLCYGIRTKDGDSCTITYTDIKSIIYNCYPNCDTSWHTITWYGNVSGNICITVAQPGITTIPPGNTRQFTAPIVVEVQPASEQPPAPTDQTLTVVVEDMNTGQVISDATVQVGGDTQQTDSSGKASYQVAEGTYQVQVSADNYSSFSSTVVVEQGQTVATVHLVELANEQANPVLPPDNSAMYFWLAVIAIVAVVLLIAYFGFLR